MKTMGDEDYHCVGICIVHERDAPDDRVMVYIVYYVCICITYIYVSQTCILVICMQGIYILSDLHERVIQCKSSWF